MNFPSNYKVIFHHKIQHIENFVISCLHENRLGEKFKNLITACPYASNFRETIWQKFRIL